MEQFEILVTIPDGADLHTVRRAIRRLGGEFSATAHSVLGTHGQLMVSATTREAAIELLKTIAAQCHLRPGL